MIEELFGAFEESDANAGPEELAEILWLAARIDGTGSHMPDRPKGAPRDESAPPPGALESSSTADAGDPRPTEQFYSAADVVGASVSAVQNVDLVRIRRAASLHDPLAVMRALRPLGRHAGLPGDIAHSELDEELTVRSTIEHGLPVPVFRPRRGHWLDLALVVDSHHSMLLWHDLVSELRRVVAQSGIFRDVRTWHLSGTGQQEALSVARAGGEPRSVQAVTDPSGHQLVLIVTDTVASRWGASGLQDALRHWASHGPVALLNVLPRRLWDRGAIRPQPHLVRAPRPAAPNTSWRLGHAAGSRRRHRHRAALDESIAIPVVEASPGPISALAELVAGGGRWSSLPCLTLPRRLEVRREPDAPGPTLEAPVAADESLRRFRASASPLAQMLAGYLSAVPLNLPVMNLVRQIMLPASDPGHLAEVALGGLFEPWEHEASSVRADLERMPFRFRPGVREALLGSQRRDKITTVQEVVRREMGTFVTEQGSGLAGDFLAARGAAGKDGSRTMAQDALPFANRASMPSPVGRPVREALATYEVHPLPSFGRDVHVQLSEAIRRATNGVSSLVLLVGERGSGKTSATTRALRQIPDDWRLWSPDDFSLTLARGAPQVGPRTIVLIEDLQRYTTLSGSFVEATARTVLDLIEDSERAPVLVMGTLTPSAWDNLMATAQGDPPDDYESLRHLISRAEVIRASPVDATPERWPGEPSQTRLAMIAITADPVRPGSKIGHLGTGFLLGPRLILTAAHPLNQRNRPRSVKVGNRHGRITAESLVDCRVLWTNYTYDAALLLAEEDLGEDTTGRHFSTPHWAQPSSEPLSPCHVTGVTVAHETSPQASGHLTGTLHPTSTHPDAPYNFEPTTALPQPGSFARGLTGAPVFFGEYLLGLVVARTDPSKKPRLSVASIGTLANDPAFIEVCRQYMPRVPRLNLLPAPAPAGDSTSDGLATGLQPPRVFISYAHEDDNGTRSEQVHTLERVLRAEGIDVRLDHIDAEVSRDWTAWMRQEIETADAILVIASPAYKHHAETPEAEPTARLAFEARLLRNELTHTPDRRILPVLLPGSTSEDLPTFFRRLHPLVIDPITRSGADQLLRILARRPPPPDQSDPPEQARHFTALAEHQWRTGRHAEALATADEAIAIYRRLASDNPPSYQPDLASSLNNLSIRLGELRRHEDALTAIEEAVTVYRDLAAARPDAFLPNLASSLNNLSIRLGELRRHEDALTAIEEAVTV
ncbi:SAV_2336 N-terminal domain-related protein, partial [Streptomyces sp. NPDC048489]|uniref:SAV_2336 N-terminal domain-related protein n=1 Tax=Streptomyces sp. NPDC048489 TaxID=3154504 RepID=UPI00343AE960